MRALFCVWFAFSTCFAESVKVIPISDPKWPTWQAVELYNTFYSADRMFAALRIGLTDSDAEFLDQLAKKSGTTLLPWATVKDGAVHFFGVEHPLKVVDAQKRLFSYNNIQIEFTTKDGLEKLVNTIEKAITVRKTALWDLALPRAEAATDWGMIAGAALSVGGLVTLGSCISGAGFGSGALGCLAGGAATAAGLALIIPKLFAKKSSAREVRCGGRRVAMMNQSGQVIWGAQGGRSSPGSKEVPKLSGKQIAQRMVEFCRFKWYQDTMNALYRIPPGPPGVWPGAPPGTPIPPWIGATPGLGMAPPIAPVPGAPSVPFSSPPPVLPSPGGAK